MAPIFFRTGTRSDTSDDDVHLKERVFSIQHDGWSNEAQDSFLGISLSFVDTTDELFKIKVLSLGCHPHDAMSHTSESNSKNCQEVLDIYNIKFHHLAFATQDTTGSSINTFDDVSVVGQIPCFAHLCNLFLKHGIENYAALKASI